MGRVQHTHVEAATARKTLAAADLDDEAPDVLANFDIIFYLNSNA